MIQSFLKRHQLKLLPFHGCQAALVGEPDPLVYGLGMVFTTFVDRIKAWFEQEILPTNELLRWICNDKLPARLALKGYFHACESEENRSEMIGWVMSTFHLLHMIDILTPQIGQARTSRLRAEGVATFRDVHPRMEELPVACRTLLRHSLEKVNKPAATVREALKFTKEELKDFPADINDCPPESDEEGDPWEDLMSTSMRDPPSERLHMQPPKAAPAASASQAAVTGAPSPENVHQRGQVESYRYRFEENIRGEVAEHIVIDSHPYELITKTSMLGNGWGQRSQMAMACWAACHKGERRHTRPSRTLDKPL